MSNLKATANKSTTTSNKSKKKQNKIQNIQY